MRKEYYTPRLLVHGSVEEMTLGPPAPTPQPHDPKPIEGNDGLGVGEGEAGGAAS